MLYSGAAKPGSHNHGPLDRGTCNKLARGKALARALNSLTDARLTPLVRQLEDAVRRAPGDDRIRAIEAAITAVKRAVGGAWTCIAELAIVLALGCCDAAELHLSAATPTALHCRTAKSTLMAEFLVTLPVTACTPRSLQRMVRTAQFDVPEQLSRSSSQSATVCSACATGTKSSRL